jgi:hypothetical protein
MKNRKHQNLYALSYNKSMTSVDFSDMMVHSYSVEDSSLLGCDAVVLG